MGTCIIAYKVICIFSPTAFKKAINLNMLHTDPFVDNNGELTATDQETMEYQTNKNKMFLGSYELIFLCFPPF